MISFEKKFTWGVATSSFQIEGAAHTDGRGVSIWDTFCDTPGKVANGDNGDFACDHYNRFEEDVQIMRDMGVQAYRFSLAWPRMFPNGDSVREERGFDFYNRLIDTLLAAGIKPLVTLYHWDLPQPLQDRGGWANREIVPIFAEYAKACAEAFGDRVSEWVTINEPWCVSWLGYMSGVHAPGVKNLDHAIASAHHTALAHAEAVRAIRSVQPTARCGAALNMTNYVVVNPEDSEVVEAAALMDSHVNRWWIESQLTGQYPQNLVDEYGDSLAKVFLPGDEGRLKIDAELLGVNYYNDSFLASPRINDGSLLSKGLFPFSQRVNDTPPAPHTDMGWPVTPEGIYNLLMRINRDYPEFTDIAITENGAAFDDGPDSDGIVKDDRRVEYFNNHIAAAMRAVAEGSALRSYFAWSLLDNFEWAEGYDKRFGLVHVDFVTFKRTLKESAKTYSAIIANNGAMVAR
jgi:beta-glucosidase